MIISVIIDKEVHIRNNILALILEYVFKVKLKILPAPKNFVIVVVLLKISIQISFYRKSSFITKTMTIVYSI